MSDRMLDEVRKRVEARIAPFVRVLGEDAAVVKIAREVLADVEDVARWATEEALPTSEAAELSGYHPETLARHARAVTEGTERDPAWRGLQVERRGDGWLFVVSSIPRKAAA